MKARELLETVIGGVVLVAAVVFVIYLNGARDSSLKGASYELEASFSDVGGLSTGSDVRMAGVRVGTVRDVGIDYDTYQAVVRMEIAGDALVPEDSLAAVVTSGLLGDTSLSIIPGAEEEALLPGDSFVYTRGAVDIINAIVGAVANSESN